MLKNVFNISLLSPSIAVIALADYMFESYEDLEKAIEDVKASDEFKTIQNTVGGAIVIPFESGYIHYHISQIGTNNLAIVEIPEHLEKYADKIEAHVKSEFSNCSQFEKFNVVAYSQSNGLKRFGINTFDPFNEEDVSHDEDDWCDLCDSPADPDCGACSD